MLRDNDVHKRKPPRLRSRDAMQLKRRRARVTPVAGRARRYVGGFEDTP
jgi:hypothetical protein